MRHFKIGFLFVVFLGLCSCKGQKTTGAHEGDTDTTSASLSLVAPKYATGWQVRDSAGIRLVDVGTHDRLALVRTDEAQVPEGYTKIRVPIERTICMTMLQLSNFTILDAHDVVTGLTGTKNLYNKDIQSRVKGYEPIKETGITLVPHLGYKELDPLGQAEWIKFVGMFIGKEQEANDIFTGIEQRYNDLKAKAAKAEHRPTVFSGEMHSGTWHAVGGKNYLAQIFRDAGADYVITDEETAGENLEFEKMYALAAKADYWRILNSYPGDFSYEALKASEPRNELFDAFKQRKVIYCNMKQTPYYEISPVEPDVLLKDLVAIFHPELVESDYQPTFYQLLK